MKERFFIFIGLILLVVLLIGLNAASYTRKDEKPDEEAFPNRSTYHVGATGTRAFYDLLQETGRKPMRWGEKPSALLIESKNTPQTFVVIGDLRRNYTDEESEQLLRWVSLGGKLVLIDRIPSKDFIATTANWQISTESTAAGMFGVDSSSQMQMTEKVNAAKPLLPTIFTKNIVAVQPSKFASAIKLQSYPMDKTTIVNSISAQSSSDYEDYDYNDEDEPPPPIATPKKNESGIGDGQGTDAKNSNNNNRIITAPASTPTPAPHVETIAQAAPVVHLANNEKTLLVDYPYGEGQIVLLSDPYIVSNAGIGLVDNAQLAINVVASREGIIAFDEYHHGFAGGENHLLAYFAETPLPAILAQVLLLIGIILFTQSRRFARPLPADEPSRLSKLEYVSAMAELQSRTRAYDLAIENIYSEFRRRATRFFGVDNYTTSRKNLADLIAERAKFRAEDVEKLFLRCENIIQGEATSKREVLEITSRLREIEEKLGLKRNRKEAFKR